MKINIHEPFTSKEEAQKFKQKYLRSYGYGYGTELAVRMVEDHWVVEGSRWSSCD